MVEPEGLPQDNFKGPEFRMTLRGKDAARTKKRNRFAMELVLNFNIY